jgi:hypothetical protein
MAKGMQYFHCSAIVIKKMAKWLHECNTTSFPQTLIENGKMET